MNTNIFAPVVINNYVWYEMQRIDPAFTGRYDAVPFFPLYDNQAGNSKWGNKSYVVYDPIKARRKTPFYPVKRESLLYSVRGIVPEVLYMRDLLDYVLDRGDDAAKDLNEWAGENVVNNQVFIHSFSTTETNWSSEITTAKDTRQPVTKNLIVDYEYHLARYLNDGQDPFVPGTPSPGGGIEQMPAPSYNWDQSTPATTWTVNHNLGFKPVVQVFDTNGQQMEALVVHTSNLQAVIYFVIPQAGYARFV